MMFRQIRLITKDNSILNKYVVFVDTRGCQTRLELLKTLVVDGFYIGNRRFVLQERQPSMTRQGILSFVDEEISKELDERITMGIKLDKTVLAKYVGYRGLMFSSCHCLENFFPKMIVVPDYFTTIKDQNIKYVYDEHLEYVDKNGTKRDWKQKGIKQGIRDVKINAFDGAGIIHPYIAKQIKDIIQAKEEMTSIQIRGPYIKGLLHSIDYTKFYKEHGITHIKDIWGVEHSIEEPMIILSPQMWKCSKYFKRNNDYTDWEEYLNQFKKYNHCLGVAKWNFQREQEPIYTRANYQILQDLDLSYNDFRSLADYTIDWVDKICNDDIRYTYCFLGLLWDLHNPRTDYVKAILKNPEMMKEKGVRDYVVDNIRKYIDEQKCGKIYIKSTFKFLVPDLIAMMEHIGGMEVNGCLQQDEFYQNDINGPIVGKRLIERNPHICKSEHTILNGVVSEQIQKWCGHLQNVLMVNIKSITPQRLNGADQ